MEGYKAFNTGYIAFGGFQYEIGKEYEIKGELKMCENGFHFCENLIDVFGYYNFDREVTVLAEVEASGKVAQEGTKFCAEKIKIVRPVSWKEVDTTIEKSRHNSGRRNSGDKNSGHYNSGSYNSGHYNSGSYNSGNYNNGVFNSGDYNSGDYNSGRRNSGNHNIGSYNNGSFNSGDYNSGNYNSGNCNCGFFNSNTPTVRLFNKDSGMTFEEIFELDIDWSNLELSKEIIKELPNYDAQIFFEATGIDWRNEI